AHYHTRFVVGVGRPLRAGGNLRWDRGGAGRFVGGGTDSQGTARHGLWNPCGGKCRGRFFVEPDSRFSVVRGFGQSGVFFFRGVILRRGAPDPSAAKVIPRATIGVPQPLPVWKPSSAGVPPLTDTCEDFPARCRGRRVRANPRQ